jgi:hypothetical protein
MKAQRGKVDTSPTRQLQQHPKESKDFIIMQAIEENNTPGVLGFWTLPIARNSKYYKTQRFGNWIHECFTTISCCIFSCCISWKIIVTQINVASGDLLQKGQDIKTNWPTDRRWKCDFDFDMGCPVIELSSF